MGGHVVDGNTVHLWKLNETATFSAFRNVADLVTPASPMTTASLGVAPRVVKGPRNNCYARTFNGTSSLAVRTSSIGAFSTALLASAWTIRAWINVETLSALRSAWSFAGNGESSNVNALAAIQVTTGGKLQMWWENGSGVDVYTTQSAGGTVSINTWYGAAWVKSGGNILFYLFNEDGTPVGGGSGLQDTVAYSGAAASGGSSTIAFGADTPASPISRWHGAVGALEVLNTDLNAAAIAAGFVDTNFSSSANSVGLWNMTEEPDAIDLTGNMHLVAPVYYSRGTLPIFSEDLSSTWCGGTSAFLESPYASYPAQQSLLALFQSSNYTFEAQIRLDSDDPAITKGIFCQGTPGTDASSTTNLLAFQLDGTRNLSALSEYNTGTDALHTSSSPILSSGNKFDAHTFAIVKNSGAYKAYIDAVEVDSWTFSNAMTDGSLGTFKLASGSAGVAWSGALSDVRISNIARTTTELSDYYALVTASSGPSSLLRGLGLRRYGLGGDI